MICLTINRKIVWAGLAFLMMVGLTYLTALPAYSHGGKTHAQEFTAFQAVQKATQLYDRLIASGKLPEAWETELKTITVDTRNKGNQNEYVVQFETTKMEMPSSVFFFFSQKGTYSGSNFTGE